MTALFIKCWLTHVVKYGAAVAKKATTATTGVRRYRRVRRIAKAAGAASVKTAARKAAWVCVVTGPLLLPPGSVGPLFDAPIRITPEMGATNTGTTGQLAFLPPGAGTDEPLFFVLPPGSEADFSLPPGTVEIVLPPGGFAFAPVPDCCSPAPPQPQPEQPIDRPTPVPEPSGLLLLATAVALLRILS
jgi:hypothetical protein